MESTSWTEQWSAMQKMFLPTPEFSATLQENARRFWENQEKILTGVQEHADGWFERRRVGTQAAREAAHRMCGTEPGTDMFSNLLQTYQDWTRGAFERLMADTLSWQKQIMAVTANAAAPPLAPSASEKEIKRGRIETKGRNRLATARS